MAVIDHTLAAEIAGFRPLAENLPIGISIADKQDRFLYVNPKFTQMLGFTLEDIRSGKEWFEKASADELIRQEASLSLSIDDQNALAGEFKPRIFDVRCRNGSIKTIRFRPLAPQNGLRITLYEDISKEERFQDALRESEERYRLLADNVTDIISIVDLNLRITYVSPSVTRITGYTVDEIMATTMERLFTQESVEHARKVVAQELARDKSGIADKSSGGTIELEGFRKDGARIWVEVGYTLLRNSGGEPVHILCVVREITDRKIAEQALRESERNYRQLVEHAPTGIYELDFVKNKFVSVNDVMCKYTGYSKEELLRMSPFDILTEESQKLFLQRISKMHAGEKVPETAEFKIKTKHGREIWVLIDAKYIYENGFPKGATVVVHDITDRKLSEEALRQSEEKYRLLVENANDAIFIAQDGRIKFPNPKTLQILGYSVEELNQIPYMSLVQEEDREFVSQERLRRKKGSAPPSTYSLRALNKAGQQVWAQISSVSILWENRLATLNFVRDITVQRLAEERLRQTVSRLRKITGATVQAMAQTVEVRDPYTAGHQRRVSDLARAIASQMALTTDQVDGVRLAGMIHDIGKISVPSEILSKPGLLNNLEFALIKTHPQVGYDILKDIEFPWDIATMILQHHERIDGSGYPKGLSGDSILLEAKILAVADVVEAMASHRPYRPALGMEKAFNEIIMKRGKAYDAEAVDACLKLFEEKKFDFRW